MNGVVVIDKPGGLTSFDVVARVRRALGEKRVGHTGTLDPMATGVLPVCVGEATKLVPFLVGGDKEYEAELCLGVTTDSLDATGTVTSETNAAHVSRADVERALPGFVGTIQQRPPMHSAVRVDGQRLYKLAHQGLEIERQPRAVVVHAIELLGFEAPRARLRVRCGKGTYIRSLARDLGERLGCGALVQRLRRTRVGPFTVDEALTLEAEASTARARLLPIELAVAELPRVILPDAELHRLCRGQAVARGVAPPSADPGTEMAVFDGANDLAAVAKVDAHGFLRPLKVLRT